MSLEIHVNGVACAWSMHVHVNMECVIHRPSTQTHLLLYFPPINPPPPPSSAPSPTDQPPIPHPLDSPHHPSHNRQEKKEM